MSLESATILLTGGTGTFGRQFVKSALKQNPRQIRVFSRGELLQLDMKRDFPQCTYLIGDVRDKDRLIMAANSCDVIVHAAALKQVPAAEYNPLEAVKTNVIGTANTISAAIANNVPKVLFISSDKSASPINLYGKTKAVAESLVVQANSYTGSGKTKFSCVRYGNVMGSRGSVIPLFQQLKEEGKEALITDYRMSRFWLTIEQGIEFVLNCLDVMQGGEIFIPKLPTACITDIALAVFGDPVMCENTGIRSGEKLHETLIVPEEGRHCKSFDSYYVIEPENPEWEYNPLDGEPAPEGFYYSSNTNHWKLTVEEIREWMK